MLTVLSVMLFGQNPMYFNTNAAGGQNSIPFNSGATLTWRRAQFCMPAGNLGPVPPGNNITVIYFQAGSTANVVYPTFTVRLKTATAAGMQGIAGGQFEQGMTQVFQANNFNMITTSGQWYAIPLQVPFLYNPTLPLIVDFEHNSTNAAGPTVMQPGVISLGGSNGRQWGDGNNANIAGVGTQQFNFGIDVIPATPCTAAPPVNTISPAQFSTCPFIANPTMSLASTYSFGGITYQWQSSTVSPVGPWTAIPGATMASTPSGTINQTTWFTCVATCTNPGGGATTITPTQFFVAGSVTATPPYFEDFEGLQANNRLPNCSWTAPALGTGVTTWMSSQSGNRIAKSGNKFGNFVAPTTNNYVYTNGITLQPGITYSAAIWYSTEYTGGNNWSNLSLNIGPNQSPTGMQLIAQVSPAVSGAYKLLSGVFTVPSAGDYYIGIRATGTSGAASFLNFDDLSVTIPCDGLGAVNSPTILLPANSATICQGDPVTINASGANSYLWMDGTTGPIWSGAPMSNTIITVAGSNALTGCVALASQSITVNNTPTLLVVAGQSSVCPGESTYLTAMGAVSYAWNNGAITQVVNVAPSSSTTYSVNGTGSNGCSTTGTVAVAVKPQPTVTILPAPESCIGDMVSITAVGAVSYNWYSSSNPAVLAGATINVPLSTSTTFTAFGTGANGCVGKNTISQSVVPCTGISMNNISKNLVVYPNPSTGVFNIELSSGVISSVSITDVSGRVVMTSTNHGNSAVVDLGALSDGVYYATITDGEDSHQIRLIRQ